MYSKVLTSDKGILDPLHRYSLKMCVADLSQVRPDLLSVKEVLVIIGGLLDRLDDVMKRNAAANVQRRSRRFDDVQRRNALDVDVSVVRPVIVENA